MIEKKTSAILKIFYKNYHNGATEVECVKFEKDKCIADISYRENAEDAIMDIVESSGVWINQQTFIPFHMILQIGVLDIGSVDSNDIEVINKDESLDKPCSKPIVPESKGVQSKSKRANTFRKSRRRPSKSNKLNKDNKVDL